MKYIIYCRKSSESEDRQVLSLESQESELRQIAKREGLNVAGVYRESMSAKSPGRPVFNQVMGLIESGKADALLCWKMDRLSRNPIDNGKISWLSQQGVLKEIRTFERAYLPSDNVLLMAVEQGMANQYIRDLSVNVKRGNRAKLERGEWPNHAPIGYVNNKVDKSVDVDPLYARYVIRVFEIYSKGGRTMKEVANTLHQEGFRSTSGGKLFPSMVHKIITNPFYYGVMKRDGQLYPGKHRPLVSKEQFDNANAVLSSKLHSKAKRLFFPFRGFMRCEVCGCMLTASLKKGHAYYYCTNGKGACDQHRNYLRSEDLAKLVGGVFGKIHYSEELIDIMYRAAKEQIQNGSRHLETTLEALQKELQALEARQLKLSDSYLAQVTPEGVYKAKMSELTAKEISVREQARAVKVQMERGLSTLEPTKEIFLRLNRAQKELVMSDEQKQRELLEILLWNLSVKDKKVASYKLKQPYERLLQCSAKADFQTKLAVWFDVGTYLATLRVTMPLLPH